MPKCWEGKDGTQTKGAALAVAAFAAADPKRPRHTLTIRADKFAAFSRLSAREQRPVEDVLREWVHDCATLINLSEFADVSGDALPLTPAMRAAAAAADERERRGNVDDEQAAREHAALGAGYVELQVALD